MSLPAHAFACHCSPGQTTSRTIVAKRAPDDPTCYVSSILHASAPTPRDVRCTMLKALLSVFVSDAAEMIFPAEALPALHQPSRSALFASPPLPARSTNQPVLHTLRIGPNMQPRPRFVLKTSAVGLGSQRPRCASFSRQQSLPTLHQNSSEASVTSPPLSNNTAPLPWNLP